MNNWKEYRIKDICNKIVSGGTPLTTNKDYYYPATIPWLKTGEVNYSYIYQTENFISEKGLKNSSAKLIPVNSIIVAMYGQGNTAGRVAINKIPLTTNQACCNLQINEKIAHCEFVYYYLRMQYQQLVLYKTGGAQPNLNVDKIKKLKVQLPSLPTQNKIAHILSRYDEAIENNNKRIKLLEQMAQNLYKEWFVRFRFPGWENCEFENGIPVGWHQLKLDDIADIIMGQSPESCYYNYEKKGLPFHQGCSNYGEFYLIDEIYSTKGSRFAEPGSIIFSVRAPVGKLNITFNKIILGRGVAAINSKTGKNAFLYWLLKNKFSKEDMIGNGSVFASVTKYELLQQKFLIPPEDIIDSFDLFANNIERMMRTLYKQNTNLAKQRDLLLPRLMSGKIEVR